MMQGSARVRNWKGICRDLEVVWTSWVKLFKQVD